MAKDRYPTGAASCVIQCVTPSPPAIDMGAMMGGQRDLGSVGLIGGGLQTKPPPPPAAVGVKLSKVWVGGEKQQPVQRVLRLPSF